MIPPKSTFALLIGLYFSQGLPSGLLAHTLPALMRSYGVGLEWISLLKLLALPWFLKFLWAPFIDQRWQRKHWIVLFQTMAITTLLLLSCLDPQNVFNDYLLPFLALLLILNTCSASQDIASDGLAMQQLPTRYLGLANSIQVAAYKLGLIGGGTALLIVIDAMGWQFSLRVFAGLLILALLPVFLTGNHNQPANLAVPETSAMPFSAVFSGFIRERHMLLWLLLIASYKMADSLGSGMIKPMLVDYGYSLADIGYLASISSIGGIIGAIVGGFWFMRLKLPTALILFGALQTVGIGLLALIPARIDSTAWVYGLSLFEQFSDGLATVALFAAMMMHCRKGLEGTDYTLQNSVALMGAGTAAMAGGFLAAEVGYSTLFMIAAATGLIPLVLILQYRKHITKHYR